METIPDDDIKTTRKILITEVLLVVASIVLLTVFPVMSFMLTGIVLVSFATNVAWSVRLLTKRPPGYIVYTLIMLGAGVIIPVAVIINAIRGITC